MFPSLEGNSILVTGGGTGIGAATALLLARSGAKVVITGRSEATLKEAAAQHKAIRYVVADISKPADVARSIAEVLNRHGKLDVLVNNAAVCEFLPLAAADLEHVRRTFDINVIGLIETTRHALPHLEKSKGSIINIASTVADQPFANMSVYCASKGAVLSITRSWAQELAPKGIRVNAVSPGPIETPAYDPVKMKLTAEQIQQLGASVIPMVPLARFGKSDEVAPVVAFLASSAASYVTGAQYTVGGGIEA